MIDKKTYKFISIFDFKDNESKQKFLDYAYSENGIKITIVWSCFPRQLRVVISYRPRNAAYCFGSIGAIPRSGGGHHPELWRNNGKLC